MDCFVVIGKGNRKWYYILVFISDLESEAEMMEGNCVVKWAGGGVDPSWIIFNSFSGEKTTKK